MKKTILRFIIVAAIFAALIGAYLRGRRDVWVNEFKTCQAHMTALTYWETNQPPELREYVKARYYYLANRIPKEWLGNPKDFGDVSTNVDHLATFKGPSSGHSEYRDFLVRYGLPKQ